MNTITLSDGSKQHTLPKWIGIQAKGDPMTKTKWRRTDVEYFHVGGYTQIRNHMGSMTYTTYDTALDMVSKYYEEWGYEPTLKYLRQLNSSGEIPLMTRVKIQDIITDRYLEPSPRALIRKFRKC
jgi:hypothetical protein